MKETQQLLTNQNSKEQSKLKTAYEELEKVQHNV